MVDIYILCIFWIFCVLFTEEPKSDICDEQPQNEAEMTAEKFLTIEDLFGDEHMMTEAQLIEAGDDFDIAPIVVRLMIQDALAKETLEKDVLDRLPY